MKNMYKVVIPCAGTGSRLEGLSKYVNKALVTVNQKPAITYVIDKFPEDVEIVIPLGFKGESIKDFLGIAYPNRSFTFVEVDLFEGPGSGLGYSLLKCKQFLNCPFIFIPNDSIVDDDIPSPKFNWMGYSSNHTSDQYRSLKISNGHIEDILAKGSTGDVFPYIGLAGIKNYEEFWNNMERGVNSGSIEVGESYGLKMMLGSAEIKPIEFIWHDTGNLDSLEEAKNHLPQGEVEANILDKADEAIWFYNNKVIKFHKDKSFISERVIRANELKGFVPQITDSTETMYSYDLVNGQVFSRNVTTKKFEEFLKFADKFWKKIKLNIDEEAKFYLKCNSFYRDKTYERVDMFFKRFEVIDREVIVNDQIIPEYKTVLDNINWDLISKGIPSRFHGDLHFENILYTNDKSNRFCLIDWRQNFSGDMHVGDIYYDLAKLNHGLIISHELIHKNLFNVEVDQNIVSFDFNRKHILHSCQNVLKEYAENNNYDWNRIRDLTSLIFLNVAALHEYPYSLLLYYLGLSSLWNDNS